MKCPDCIDEGKQSKVYCHGGTSTLMYCPPYYDEEGEYHSHDRNTNTYSYSCSNKHNFCATGTSKCPNPKCDWGGMEVIPNYKGAFKK